MMKLINLTRHVRAGLRTPATLSSSSQLLSRGADNPSLSFALKRPQCVCVKTPDNRVKMGETESGFLESLYQHDTESYAHAFYIFSVKRGLGAIENTVLGGVCSVALVSLNRTEVLLWKFLAFGPLVVFSTLVPPVSSLVGAEGKSWAKVNLVLFFCVGRKERVTQLMEVVAKIRGPALCPLLH